MASIKAIVAAATMYAYHELEGCSFGGPLGNVILWADGGVDTDPLPDMRAYHTHQERLDAAKVEYSAYHPALGGVGF